MSRNDYVGVPYAPRTDNKEIVFIRHAESEANVAGLWHGRTDGPLSGAGKASLEALTKRMSSWRVDLVVSSPLTRALRTAQAVSDDVAVDDEFIEMDVGRWEGLSFEETDRHHRDEMVAAFTDWDVRMGGTGETLNEVGHRALSAMDRIFSRLADGERAVVVTHGGFLQPILNRHLPARGRRVHPIASNTSLNRVISQWDRTRLVAFNDTGHLGPRSRTVISHLEGGTPVLALVRHGQTRANTERRWQGHGDWDLDEEGVRQAELLGEWYGRSSKVYSSPLRRAMATARRVAIDGVVAVDGLKEMNMGEWEGLTSEEISTKWPEVMESIYRQGVDLRRGGTGESWGELTSRVVATIATLEPSFREPTVVVAHGGAIRSYISSLTDTSDSYSESLFTPMNTSVSHVALTPEGPEIVDFSVAAHLETDGG